MRNAKFDEGKGVTKLQYLLSVLVILWLVAPAKTPMVRFICDVLTSKRAFILRCLVVVIEQKITRRISLFKDGTRLW